MKARKPRFRSETLQALHDRYVGDDPERVASFEAALANAEVARDIYRLRVEAGLSQRQLAAMLGTTASVICRLEDAEYEGHSLSMLRRIAGALGRRVEIRFVSDRLPASQLPKPKRAASPSAETPEARRTKADAKATPRAEPRKRATKGRE